VQSDPRIAAIAALAFLGWIESSPANVYATTHAGDDTHFLDQTLSDAAFYLLDRRYAAFARVYLPRKNRAFVGTRIMQTRHSWQRDRPLVRHSISRPSDPTIQLTVPSAAPEHPDPPRCIHNLGTGKSPPSIFLVNNNQIPALTIAKRYPSPRRK
jgi:hypothetical protein